MLSIQQLLNPQDEQHLTSEVVSPSFGGAVGSPIRPVTPHSLLQLSHGQLPSSTPWRTVSTTPRPPILSPLAVLSHPTAHNTLLGTQYNVVLNKKTALQKLFHYNTNTVLEYPETLSTGAVGHLFEMSPGDWVNPQLSFVYSQGAPEERSEPGKHIYCSLLVDKNNE